MRPVAITGIGLLTALGVGAGENWKRLLDSDTAVGRIRSYDTSSFHSQLGAEIEGFQPERYANRRLLRTTTRNDQLAIAGAVLAMEDSGASPDLHEPTRRAVFVGGSKEISTPEDLMTGSLVARLACGRADLGLLGEHARSAFSPRFYLEGLQSAALFYLSSLFGSQGANAYFHGTADAGAQAIGRAFRSVSSGQSEIAVAGGADDATSWWNVSKMDGLGLLTTKNDQGSSAFRPYDVERSGSVLGEGAAFVVLEAEEAARRRGAHVYATIRGCASTFDTYGMMTPDPNGATLSTAMTRALDESTVDVSDVDYVATHGSGTLLGDISESRALRTTFGGGQGFHASTVKPATGHLVAAAGALNIAVAALAIDSSTVPPLLNLERAESECTIAWVRGDARQLPVRNAVALARGLLGQQLAMVLGSPRWRSS